MEALRNLCTELRQTTEALNQATTPFAARRVDARVRQAPAGQRIDSLSAQLGGSDPAPSPAPSVFTRIQVLPHPDLCPNGTEFDAKRNRKRINVLLRQTHGPALVVELPR
jgi:hypothetical protein